ncbi:DUF1798 family protein [Aquibacillus salsiterrae]|uniref:YppE family protein n=1 Tax=Aquibacillus salsiterrae TaxID=2950439 RepID=A0A9X3WBF4_9BACI|nr:DUF1798 family protein [Aquibacillus salsiterrae]MDC3415338.1 YppE family protein [Aquibacillus salsiterrae]
MDFLALTNELERTFAQLKDKYLTSEKPLDKRDQAFFNYVKEETTPLYKMIQQWETLAETFVKRREVGVHPQQVVSTKENLELLLLHSYYIDVKRKRYMELYQSIQYVFDLLRKSS